MILLCAFVYQVLKLLLLIVWTLCLLTVCAQWQPI
jgi:hypothetical protein